MGTCCVAQGAQLLALWWPRGWRWDGGEIKERGDIGIHIADLFCCTRETNAILSAIILQVLSFPGGSKGKESTFIHRRPGFDPWVWKIPWRREWHPIPVFLPGEFHGQRILANYSPWDPKESDTAEWLTLSLYTPVFKKGGKKRKDSNYHAFPFPIRNTS